MLLKGPGMAPCTLYALKVLTGINNDDEPHEILLTLSLFTWQAVSIKDGLRSRRQEAELMSRDNL